MKKLTKEFFPSHAKKIVLLKRVFKWIFQKKFLEQLSKYVYFAITSKPNIYNVCKYKFIKIQNCGKKTSSEGAMSGITQKSCVTLFPLKNSGGVYGLFPR